MSCNKQCPHMGRGVRVPKHRLDAVRRKLEFSDEVSETSHIPPPPANKYEHFKKVSESHSSHIMEPPMYSSAEMAVVPDSFLEAFAGKRDVAAGSASRRKPVAPPCEESAEMEMPDSFLEFCQARIAARPPPSPVKTPPRRPNSEGSYYVPCPTNPSYYGYDDPQHGMIFNPRISPTPMSPKKSPPKSPQPEYYYPPPFKYYRRAASFERETPYNPPGTGAVGLGKYAYPASSSPPTPPTPASACGGQCGKSGTYGESTVSSGDLLGSSSKRGASSRRSHTAGMGMSVAPCAPHAQPEAIDYGSYRYPTPPPGAVGIGNYAYPHSHNSATPPTPPSTCAEACGRSSTFEDSVVGPPLAQSTPISTQFRYEMTSVRRETSSSSIPANRRRHSDTVCNDDLIGSGKSSPRCPTLGVTPVHSGVSVSSSGGNMASGRRQNISKSIETELRAREVQERNQLECDLTRWQEARRRLVMNTANMGS